MEGELVTPRPSPSAELHELLIALGEGELSGPQFARLQRLLAADPAARAYYEKYMRLCALLEFEFAVPTRGESRVTSPADVAASGHTPPVHHTSFIVHHFELLGGALLPYAIAALITGVGILAAWTWKVPDPPQHVAHSTIPSPVPEQTFVGKITQMRDCRWADMKRTELQIGGGTSLHGMPTAEFQHSCASARHILVDRRANPDDL